MNLFSRQIALGRGCKIAKEWDGRLPNINRVKAFKKELRIKEGVLHPYKKQTIEDLLQQGLLKTGNDLQRAEEERKKKIEEEAEKACITNTISHSSETGKGIEGIARSRALSILV